MSPADLFTALRIPTLLVALGLTVAGCGVNNIPTYEEQAKAKLSDVNNQYQRRADLIPNLVETVRGYARQERETLEAVVNARAKATSIQITPDIVNIRRSSSNSRTRSRNSPARSAG